MTGQLIYACRRELILGGHSLREDMKIPGIGNKLSNKHTRAIFFFSGNGRLFFNDLRRFGYLKIVGKAELERIKQKFGPEPLSRRFNFDALKEIFGKRKAAIKKILMDQRLIAGIGNIYADEILFRAQVSPFRPAGFLSNDEINAIIKAAKSIISEAIKHRGTTFRNYLDSSGRQGNYTRLLKVYGREGERCFRCQECIKRGKLGGRSTYYCPKCQH